MVNSTSASISQQVQSSKKTFEGVKSNAVQAAEIGFSNLQKTLEPVDEYLKDSVFGTPFLYTLDLTEKVCDKFLLEPSQESSEITAVENHLKDGPLKRTSKLSKRLQSQAFSKMKDLSFRSNESLEAMKHSVSLIQYAANHLDSGIKTTNQFLGETLSKGVEVSNQGVQYLKEQQKKIREGSQFKEVGAKVESLTIEAIKSLGNAIDLLSKQIPVANFQETTKSIQEISKNLKQNALNLPLFSAVAAKSSSTLSEVSQYLTTYVSGSSEINAKELFGNALSKVHGVLETLLSTFKPVPKTPEGKTELN